jgi:hypothetical protein
MSPRGQEMTDVSGAYCKEHEEDRLRKTRRDENPTNPRLGLELKSAIWHIAFWGR